MLDAAACMGAEAVLTLVFRVTQRRFTTAGRLRVALRLRTRQRWRRLLGEVLEDAGDGASSALERRFLRQVERAHGLPRGMRNRQEKVQVLGGRPPQSRYLGIRLPRWRLVIELDGRGAHPEELRFRDMRRDNRLAQEGETALRYGWHDIAVQPCEVAAQIISLLRDRGWTGRPRPCGPRCRVNTVAG